MLHVLGAGYSYPDTEISNSFLGELGFDTGAFERASGIRSRRTTLPLEYIRTTRNSDPRAAVTIASASATELAHKAALQAIERAGIRPDQINCVIADVSTATQTTPSEAQRVADKLGLRVAAYDMTAGAGPVPLHFDVLSQWYPEKVPEYCLLVTGCTPTQRIDYSKDRIEPLYFGDGAAAMVVSTRHPGKLKLHSSSFSSDFKQNNELEFGKFTHAKLSRGVVETVIRERMKQTLDFAFARVPKASRAIRLLTSAFEAQSPKELSTYAPGCELSIWSHSEWSGNCLTASIPAVLAERWGSFHANDAIVCAQIGAGVSFGFAVFGAVA